MYPVFVWICSFPSLLWIRPSKFAKAWGVPLGYLRLILAWSPADQEAAVQSWILIRLCTLKSGATSAPKETSHSCDFWSFPERSSKLSTKRSLRSKTLTIDAFFSRRRISPVRHCAFRRDNSLDTNCGRHNSSARYARAIISTFRASPHAGAATHAQSNCFHYTAAHWGVSDAMKTQKIIGHVRSSSTWR